MRIILASSFVPFVHGGARFIVEWAEDKLREAGHEVERFYLPFVDTPHDLLDQAAAFRLMDLAQWSDRLIAFRPPAYVIPHPDKVLWFIHHIRAFYDLWDGPYGPARSPDVDAVRTGLHAMDGAALREARRVYTNSRVVSDRLKRYNGVDSEPLYPPVWKPERFRCDGYGDEVLVVCRAEPHKRQHLLVEAMAHVTTPVRLRLCGKTTGAPYANRIRELIREHALLDRVAFDDRWIGEEEKADLIAAALAMAYLPEDEDSYGYPSIEAAHAGKAVLTAADSGGVLELVADGRNGLVVEPEPRAVAQALDRLWTDRDAARRMGEANRDRLAELRIDWARVVEALGGPAPSPGIGDHRLQARPRPVDVSLTPPIVRLPKLIEPRR